MWLLRAAIVAPLLFLAPQPGCTFGMMCTLIGYYDGLQLEVTTAAELPPDRYALVARAEGRELRFAFEVFPDGSGGCVEDCSPRVDLGGGRELSIQGYLNSRGGHVTIGIHGEAGPSYVEVDFLRGDVPLVLATYEPEYRTTEPNGRGCGEHHSATGMLRIPAI